MDKRHSTTTTSTATKNTAETATKTTTDTATKTTADRSEMTPDERVELGVDRIDVRDRFDPASDNPIGEATDPADLDDVSNADTNGGIDGPTVGDVTYSEIDVELEDFRDVTDELEEFLDQAGDVGGIDGRNDAPGAGGSGSGSGEPGGSGPDLMGGFTPGLDGSNAKLKEWQQDWLDQMQDKATDAAANGDEDAAFDIANEVQKTLAEWNGGAETSGGAFYHDKIQYDVDEGIQGAPSGGTGQVYPAGSEMQKQLDAAEIEIRQNSGPSGGGGSQPNSQPMGPESEPLPDHIHDPAEGWGTGEDPLDPNDGHTDPVDQGVEATYDGPPPTAEDMVDLTAQYEEGYLPPPAVTGDEIDPDGHLDPYFGDADGADDLLDLDG